MQFSQKLKFGLLCSLCLFHMQAHADRDPFLTMDPIPQSGANIQSFIPKGWYLESKVEGDLDGNGMLDSVVVIRDATKKAIDEEVAKHDKFPNDQSDRVDGNRGLMVLIKEADGRYQFAGLGKNILWCTDCYGMMIDPRYANPEIRIKNQTILIKQSNLDVTSTLRFRYDKTLKHFRLIGVDQRFADRPTHCVDEAESINYLTNTRISRQLVCKENPDKVESIPEHKEIIEPAVWTLENYHFFDNPE